MEKQASISASLRSIILITLICLLTICGVGFYEHRMLESWEQNERLRQKAFGSISALEALVISPRFEEFGKAQRHHLASIPNINLDEFDKMLDTKNNSSISWRRNVVGLLKKEIETHLNIKKIERNKIIQTFYIFNFCVLFLILFTYMFLIIRLVKGFSKDLELITQAYRNAGEGNLFTQVQRPHFQEWNPVVVGFNLMQKDLQKTQNKLRHKDRLESLGNMAAGIAHEIGNPLAGILGYTELIEGKLDEEGQEDLKKIANKVAECRRIVDDLLLFCRGEEVGEALNYVSLGDLFASVREDCARDYKGIIIIHDDLEKLNIKTHGTSVKQILYNLITNAFLAGATEINIYRGTSPETDLRMIIEDNGPGISKDIAGKIFEPFFTKRPTGQGTGLGLSICHGLAKQNGGYLSLTSLSNPTRFELVLACLD